MVDTTIRNPEAEWTPQLVAGQMADELNRVGLVEASPRLTALHSEIHGLLRGMHWGRIQSGQARLRESVFEAISLAENDKGLQKALLGIVSQATCYGLTIEGHDLLHRPQQRAHTR